MQTKSGAAFYAFRYVIRQQRVDRSMLQHQSCHLHRLHIALSFVEQTGMLIASPLLFISLLDWLEGSWIALGPPLGTEEVWILSWGSLGRQHENKQQDLGLGMLPEVIF